MHEGGDILNELQLSVLLMRPYFIVCFYGWRVVGFNAWVGDVTGALRVASHVRHPTERSFMTLFVIVFLGCPLCTVFLLSQVKGEGKITGEGAVSRVLCDIKGFVHLLMAVEYCKYMYKSFGGFQRDSKGFVSQNAGLCVTSLLHTVQPAVVFKHGLERTCTAFYFLVLSLLR